MVNAGDYLLVIRRDDSLGDCRRSGGSSVDSVSGAHHIDALLSYLPPSLPPFMQMREQIRSLGEVNARLTTELGRLQATATAVH
jgi:hypothetical protein